MKEMQKTSGMTKEILDIMSIIPWWICFILAVLSFIITNHFSHEVVYPIKTGYLRPRTMTFSREILLYGKVILPVIFSAAGIISFAIRFRIKN